MAGEETPQNWFTCSAPTLLIRASVGLCTLMLQYAAIAFRVGCSYGFGNG
ncbi:hypothetical protein [Roseofilum casamattae]|uniref:Uncharacterized protein n=1 Tax=Roseofilum casamattae BLCC-M143 TaxID=3022442 RepID=A0ABT7BT75_9CYAN|nr:hypothetical protein [Roseofilum casamattae]MDJ1182387.1 hypothetical protein [Roseofilum casamattae BLCC-M143]